MPDKKDCALDATGERLKSAGAAKPGPGSAFATRHPDKMVARPDKNMLARVGFQTGGLPAGAECFLPREMRGRGGDVTVKFDTDSGGITAEPAAEREE